MGVFLSTPSARRATPEWRGMLRSGCNFYPRPPRGGRLNTYEQRLAATGFLSTPSARRATATATSLGYSVEISIHALREEGDPGAVQGRDLRPDISIHALREEGDNDALQEHERLPISIHALREEGDLAASSAPPDCAISIHALREEGDTSSTPMMTPPANFYPRPPRGGRQQKQRQNLYFQTNYTTFCTNLEEP